MREWQQSRMILLGSLLILCMGAQFGFVGCGQTATPITSPATNQVYSYFGGPFNVPGSDLAKSASTFDHAAKQIGVSSFITNNNAQELSGKRDVVKELGLPYSTPDPQSWGTPTVGGLNLGLSTFGNNSNGENNQGTGLTYLMLTPQSSAGVLRFAVSTNGEFGTVWTNALPLGRETQVAVSYDFVAGSASLYVNGQRVATGPAPIPLNAINDINVWLGRSQWPDPYFNGLLDEFRIYNGVLSDAAVAALTSNASEIPRIIPPPRSA